MYKKLKDNIAFIKSRKNSAEVSQAPKQPLYLVAFFIHWLVVLPPPKQLNDYALAHDERHTKVKNELSCFIALVGPVHNNLCAFPSHSF